MLQLSMEVYQFTDAVHADERYGLHASRTFVLVNMCLDVSQTQITSGT